MFLTLLALGLPLAGQTPVVQSLDGPKLPLELTTRYLEPSRLVLKTLDWDTRKGQPTVPAPLAYDPAEAVSAGYYFVQARSLEGWSALRDAAIGMGAEVYDYLPHNAFEAYLPSLDRVQALASEARIVIPVHPAFKIDPGMGSYGTALEDPRGRTRVAVEFWPNRDLQAEAAAIRALDLEVTETVETGRYLRAMVLADPLGVIALSRLPGVKYLQEDSPVTQRNDKSQWVVQTYQNNDRKLWNLGLMGAGVTVGHIDGRVQESSCYFDDPSGVPPGPNHRKIKYYQTNGQSVDAHGTHTAGSAVGDSRPINGQDTYDGMAPDAFLVHQSGFPSSTSFLAWLNTAHANGARIHTNSWGNDYTTAYDYWCRDIDAYSHDNEDGMVCFAETNGARVKNPENAKSVLAVAAASRNDPEILGSGGKGPTADGRQKPEVFAPGCSTYSASVNSCSVITMCGTSMASPVVAGSAALLKEYCEEGWYPTGSQNAANGFTPSGALLRAMLINGAVDMTGISGYTGVQEGFGRILLDHVAYFTGDGRRLKLVDVPNAQGLTTGQNRTMSVNIPAGVSELRLTLVWSDEPGAAFAADPTVNDLNLLARAPGGTIYHGNERSLSDGAATPNPTAQDAKNSVEEIIVYNPPAGKWYFRVEGKSIPTGPQGFAGVLTY